MRTSWLTWLGCLLILFGGTLRAQEGNALGIGERVRIEDEVLARWERVSQMGVGEKSRAWIEEGRLVLAQYRELQALELQKSDRKISDVNIEISKLKLRLIHLLRSIEDARLFELSPEQLQALRRTYESEREDLVKRRSLVRDTVLDKGERFLATYRRDRDMQRFSQRDVVAKLCLQLAELHYARSEESYFAAQDSLLARAERGLPAGMEPARDYEDAVRKYQRVIDEFPFSDYMDDALYNVAYIRENSNNPVEVEESRRLYEHLVRDFPASTYAPEAWMRLGEYWFRADGEESIETAIECYTKILDYPDYASREKALYKLGWCAYRLQDFEGSVKWFAEAGKVAVRKRTGGDVLGAALLDESVAYIAVNYADPDWPKANIGELAQLVRSDDELRQGLGFQLLNRYGDLFREETQDFNRAISAYDSLLVLFPMHPEAPFIQEKIIQCYAPGALADAQAAYQEKNQLFERYAAIDSTAVGAWRAEPEQQARVDELLERHLEENVAISMDHAYASGRRDAFDDYILQSRRYLTTFPEDSAAYQIHWNLAKTLEAELKDHQTAYDEYLTISHMYPGRDLRDAAYNAIVLSQILVDEETLAQPPVAPADGELAATPLTAMEEKKKAALENFIGLFPEDERSPEYKLLEGKLYYAHHDFDQATAVFDSLLSTWPAAPQVAEAVQLKLEGLFALGRFQEAEGIAREIQGMALPAEALARARTRQAESAYKFAEGFRQGEDHLKAAQEFRRMALEVPDAAFADASLFDAGAEFTKAAEPKEAADTYLYLAEHYPQSKYADQALSLAGFILLNDLKEQGRAARTFEQLAMNYPESSYAKSAISNASYCYEKSADWTSTIRMNTLYVQRYPDAEDASLVLFDNAGLWLKLDNVQAANGIYADFATRYPDDPRTVQAFVERAEYFARQKDDAASRAEYRQAVERNRQLQKRGTPGNAMYAARALRKLTGWRFEDYRQLRLMQPAARFEQDVIAKKNARDGLLLDLNELVQLGTVDIFYARHMIAAAHEEFARVWREQERPAWRSPEERVKGEVAIQDAALELSRLAAQSYIGTTKDLELEGESIRRQQRDLAVLSENLEAWLAATPDSNLAREDSLAIRLSLVKVAELLDSSLTESSVWTGRSRERVPEMLMATLATVEQRVDFALELRSQYRDDVFLRLADTDRNLLGGAVPVALQSVLVAYREGLEIIGQVGLDRLWRPRVEQRLRGLLFKVPRAGSAFRAECGTEFDTMVRHFLEVVDKGENYVDKAGLTEEDYASDVLDMADFNQNYAINSLMLTERMLQALTENDLAMNLTGELSDSLAAQALAYSEITKRRRDGLLALKEDYWKRFEQSTSYVHRDAHSNLDDASYFLSQTAKEVLVSAEPVVSRIRPGSVPARRMLLALAELDPATFGDRFGLSEETNTIGTSTEWLARRGYEEGFERPDHDLAAWSTVSGTVDSHVSSFLPEVPVIWLPRSAAPVVESIQPDSAAVASGDTLAVGVEETVPAVGASIAGADTVFFRHSFELTGTPVGASLKLAVDDAYFLFFNGEYIDEVESSEGAASTELKTYTLNEFLRTGTNVLALEVRDRNGSGGALALKLEARQIAKLTPEILENQIQKELEDQKRLDFQRKVSRIHVKNRMD